MMTSAAIHTAQTPPAFPNNPNLRGAVHPGRRNRPISRRRNSQHSPFSSPPSSSSNSLHNSTESIARRIQRTPSAVAKRLFAHAISSSSSFSSRSSSRKSLPAKPSPTTMSTGRIIGGGNSGIPSHANGHSRHLSSPHPTNRAPPPWSSSKHGDLRSVEGPLTLDKPQASSSGGAVTMTIQLAEPMLFLQGFYQNDHSDRTPAMLRGSLVLRIAKPTKIKAISLTFRGRARTEWPEGIPPKKSEYFEEKDIMQHTWPFFNAQFSTAELGHGADSCRLSGGSCDCSSISSAIGHLACSASVGIQPAMVGAPSNRRMSLQLSQTRSFGKADSLSGISVAQRGYRVFAPGDYIYNFELPIESCLPETIATDLGSVKYELEGVIERPGAFRPNLVGKKDVTLIRCPAETSLESSEPIAISRTWEDQLHYDIVISGKSFPLGSTIPIAFKLTPLAKVRCHRIKIFITENIEYSCKNKKVHRLDPTRKVQLFEKRADGPSVSTFAGSSARIIAGGGFAPSETTNGRDIDSANGSDNLLGDLHGEHIGPTEMEFQVQLPGCNAKEKDRIHFDTTYPNIQVHHWIKIVMRLSKTDPNDSSKRRHFEISIDSPFHILSCQATNANTALPAYDPGPNSGISAGPGSCSCPLLTRRNTPPRGTAATGSTAAPSAMDDITLPAGETRRPARPMHLIRQPSHNPPPFDYDVAPPPLTTPPPRYESVVSNGGLADYFQRLADETVAEDYSDEEGEGGGNRRMMPPLMPGGRIARSMDERRTWEPIGRRV